MRMGERVAGKFKPDMLFDFSDDEVKVVAQSVPCSINGMLSSVSSFWIPRVVLLEFGIVCCCVCLHGEERGYKADAC